MTTAADHRAAERIPHWVRLLLVLGLLYIFLVGVGLLEGGTIRGTDAQSPFRAAVKSGVGLLESALQRIAGDQGLVLVIVLLVLGITLLFTSLRDVTTNMRKGPAGRTRALVQPAAGPAAARS